MVEHYCDQWTRWNDCLPLSPSVWSDQSNQIKRSHSVSYLWYKVYQRAFNHVKDSYNKSLGLPRLFKSLWELHRYFQQLAWNSNYSGLLSAEVVKTFKVKPTVDAVQGYRTLILLKQYTDMGQSITQQVQAYCVLVGTLRHAIQLQCHQIELLAIVET
jgi:hypothetical protein